MNPPKPERKKIREAVADLKRRRILEAATDLFYDLGFTNTTLDQVAEQLGVTKPFIYSHVGSKSALLGEISSQGVQRALEAIDQAIAMDGSPGEMLARFVPDYVTAILRSQKSIAINIREEKNLDPVDAARLAALRQQFMGKIETLLSRGVESGEIRVPDTRVAAFALVGAVSWTTFWFHPAGPLSIDEISARMTATILNLTHTRTVSKAVEDA
ncbi:TetR/AcrR family transcriptional regulator [Aquibium carbonis]|uniref:TetR/AcrR family transcriptional regulator n=1 Tax=Aquibium carbonis TaxID=2495581 RepID=UPI0014785A51|nr:TetR/AcrR family transcriptional regulator [Aquibium carbonis]